MALSATTVHRFQGSLFPVNAYLVETNSAVIAVDATLGVSDASRLRAQADALGKPLAGVIVTHAHPDHYGGVSALLGDTRVPVYAVPGTDKVIRRDDAMKEQILRPMFGDEWPARRTFPNATARDGQQVTLADASFRVIDVGPAESEHDSWWVLEADGRSHVFVGDLVYNHMHAYLADGFHEQWLANLERAKRDLPGDAMLLMGHGEPSADHAILDWQRAYIQRFLAAVREEVDRGLDGAPLAERVMAEMKAFLPTDDLAFLAQLSVEPVRDRLLAPKG
jgi:glyoxylase-like metal-dependent hydrolase (beta-lactamase superfamily II)